MARFLFLNQFGPPDAAATAQLLADVTEAGAAAGHECRVVAGDRDYAVPSRRYPAAERVSGASVERVPSAALRRGSGAARVLSYVTFLLGAGRKALAGPRPDVVVGMSTPPILGALAVLAAKLRGARSAYWAMDVYPDLAFALGAFRPGSLPGVLFGAISRWTVRHADLVVALGETMADRLKAVGAERIVAIPNWADGSAIKPIDPSESRIRTARGWTGRLVALYSGNLGLAHEFETLLAAADKMRSEPDVVFAFCGAGPRLAEVEDAARARALPNVQIHPGVHRDALGDLLGAGDLHLVTLRVGLPGLLVPSKLYGILAAGRPVVYVGPPEGEVHETVSAARCGVSVEPGDVGTLVAAIRARRDARRRAAEGAAARAAFEASFTRTGQTARLVAELARLAGRPRR